MLDERLIALDLGTNTGVCIGENPEGDWSRGTTLLYRKTFKGNHGKRFLEFRDFLEAQIFSEINIIAYEEVKRFSSSAASHLFGGWRSIIHMISEENGCRMIALSPSEVKKHATGSGSASKSDMIEAANNRLDSNLPFHKSSEDLADAAWVYDLARFRLSSEIALEKPQNPPE